MTFTEIALLACRAHPLRRHRASQIEAPHDVHRFRTLFDSLGLVGDWEVPVPGRLDGYRLRWNAASDSAAVASVWLGPTCAVSSALLRGTDEEAEGLVVRQLQRVLVIVSQASGEHLEGGRQLADFCQRPLIIRVPWPLGVSCDTTRVATRMLLALMAAWLAAGLGRRNGSRRAASQVRRRPSHAISMASP